MNTNNMFLWKNTDTYTFMLTYHGMPSLSVSLDQIQETNKIDSILFIYLLKKEKLYGIN